MTTFLNDIILHNENDIQFKNSSGSNAGKISQVGDDLVLSNAVGDILLGNGSDDIFIGDGTNTVDIRFEQDMAIFADSSSTRTLTLGGTNTNLVLESPTLNSATFGATTINNKLTFTTSNGYIVFDYEPTSDTGEYTSEVPLIKIDKNGSEKTILSRVSENGALQLGHDDTVLISAGDVGDVMKTNWGMTNEHVVLAAEGGFYAYGFPSNDTTWSNRNIFRFRSDSSTASENGLYIGDGSNTQFIDLSRNLTVGTIGCGAITSTGSVTSTTLIPSSHIYLGATKYLYFDGGGNTHMRESSGDTLQITTGGTLALTLDSSQNATFAGTITHGGSNETSGVVDKRNYYCVTGSGGGNFLIGQIETSANADGAIAGTVYFAYDYGTTSDNPTIHFNFAQRQGTARGTWWYEGDDQDAASDRVSVKLIDDGSGNMYVWVVIADYAAVWVETRQRHINSAISSGQLTSATVTSGTTLFDTANDPTAEMHIGKLFAHDDVSLTGSLTVGVDDTGHDVTFYGATSGRYMQWDESDDRLEFTDNAKIGIGSANDLQLYHDGSDSYIRAYNNDLIIMQDTADKDVIFKADNGSGGTATYFYLDGSTTDVRFDKSIRVTDDQKVKLGTGEDLALFHSSGNSTIQNLTGNLTIENLADDSDIIFRGDDGGSNTITALTLDMSDAGTAIFNHDIKLADNGKAFFGGGTDLSIYHDGSNSYILQQTTGDLIIQNSVDDKDIIFKSDDGSGGVTAYLTLDGSDSAIKIGKELQINGDNRKLKIGASGDLEIYHDGTDTKMHNDTGHLKIEIDADDKDLQVWADDQSGGLAEYFRIDGSLGVNRFIRNVKHSDDVQATFGTSDDLKIYHDGANSYISQESSDGVGYLYIRNTKDDGDIYFQSDDGAGGVAHYFFLDGSVASHDGSATTALYTTWPDKSRLTLGSSRDMQLYHDGTSSYIQNQTGDLTIINYKDDKDIIFKSDDGSGGVATYFQLDGSDVVTLFSKDTRHIDSTKAMFGNSNDLQIYHDGSNTNIENTTGNLNVYQKADDKDIIFLCDDGSGGNDTYFQLDGSESLNRFYKNVLHQDSVESMWGTGLDLKIKHDGSDSYIRNFTGDLYILNAANDKDVILQSDDGSGGVTPYITLDGSATTVEIAKATNFAGNITVTGNITANGNIVGDDSTSITNISSIGADTYAADADSTTRFDLSSDEILCLIQDEDCFSATTSSVTFHTKLVAKNRVLAKTTSSDANFDGDVVYFGGTTSMDAGKIYYLNSSGNWALADADAESTAKGMLGVALGAASDTNGVLIRGMVTLDHDPGTIGDTVFLSTTAGQASSTAPSGNGDIIRVVGYCLDSSNGQVYFNPDGTFVEVSA